jgi:HAMP domain-containing protein
MKKGGVMSFDQGHAYLRSFSVNLWWLVAMTAVILAVVLNGLLARSSAQKKELDELKRTVESNRSSRIVSEKAWEDERSRLREEASELRREGNDRYDAGAQDAQQEHQEAIDVVREEHSAELLKVSTDHAQHMAGLASIINADHEKERQSLLGLLEKTRIDGKARESELRRRNDDLQHLLIGAHYTLASPPTSATSPDNY